MINVTKTFLPPFEEYTTTLKRAWDKAWITNNGELVQELEDKLKQYLGLKHLWFTNNGTVVLQMALKALGITGEVIALPPLKAVTCHEYVTPRWSGDGTVQTVVVSDPLVATSSRFWSAMVTT